VPVVKCRVCRGPAVIDLPRHNANFCPEHFVRYCRTQVERTITELSMLKRDDRVLVAVSGGKDSLALWDLLIELGHAADGLYIGLGIGGYSDDSGGYARRFAQDRSLALTEIDLRGAYDFDVPTAAAVTRRVPCSACGLSKRHLFDRAAIDGGYDAVATGHNLDDEAAVLYGNVLRWQVPYLARQRPVLAGGDGFPRKIKPLVRLTERETAAYCIIRGIDYQVEECPMASGNKHLGYKESLNELERRSPGTKSAFYFGFLERAVHRFDDGPPPGASPGAPPVVDATEGPHLSRCQHCGAPAEGEVCAFCRLQKRVAGAEPVPVDPPRRRR
jgi:tRNA(Ile)-lysidine synthase TilS/MesJ